MKWLILIGVAVCCTGLVFLISDMNSTQQKAITAQTASELKNTIEGLAMWSDSYNRIPDAVIRDKEAQPLFSWRFATTFLHFGQLPESGRPHYDKRWDSSENRPFTVDPDKQEQGFLVDAYIDHTRIGNKARFVALVGPGTAFEQGKDLTWKDLPANLMVIVETRGCKTQWMEPGGDLHVANLPRQVGVTGGIGPASEKDDAFFVVFADASVWLLKKEVPFDELAKFFTITEAVQHNRDACLDPFAVNYWKRNKPAN